MNNDEYKLQEIEVNAWGEGFTVIIGYKGKNDYKQERHLAPSPEALKQILLNLKFSL